MTIFDDEIGFFREFDGHHANCFRLASLLDWIQEDDASKS